MNLQLHKAREAKRMKLEYDRNDPVVGVNEVVDDNAEIVNLDEVERDVHDLPVTGKDENDMLLEIILMDY